MKKGFVHYLPYCGVMAAATFIFTAINLTLPFGTKGVLVHLGAAMAVVVAFVLPSVYAAGSAALGMAMYDLLSPWAIWAPFTLIIRFSQVYIMSLFLKKESNKALNYFIGFLLAGIIDVGGYYFAEVILYGNWIVPLTSVPTEIVLNLVGITLGLPAAALLKRTKVTNMMK